jgi:hypothetical protein
MNLFTGGEHEPLNAPHLDVPIFGANTDLFSILRDGKCRDASITWPRRYDSGGNVGIKTALKGIFVVCALMIIGGVAEPSDESSIPVRREESSPNGMPDNPAHNGLMPNIPLDHLLKFFRRRGRLFRQESPSVDATVGASNQK